MGKATDKKEQLSRRFQTPDEIRSREAAAEIGREDVVATLNGTFERRGVPQQQSATATESPTRPYQAPQGIWD